MPLSPSHRSGRTQDVSRQFTDEERRVDAGITSHLTTPERLATPYDMANNYKWIEEDLKARDEITKRLSDEMQLANTQSLRREMDKQFTEKTESEIEAVSAMNEVNEIMSTRGVDASAAISDVLSRNPRYLMDEKIMGVIDGRLQYSQTDKQVQARMRAEEANGLADQIAILRDKDALEILSDPSRKEQRRLLGDLRVQKEIRGLQLDPREMRLKELEADSGIIAAEKKLNDYKTIGEPGSMALLGELSNTMSQTGMVVNNLDATDALMRSDPGFASMISNPEWMSQSFKSPEEAQAFGQALDLAHDTKASEAERMAAKRIVASKVGEYSNALREHKRRMLVIEDAQKFGADTGKSLQLFIEGLADIGKPNSKGKRPDNYGDESLNQTEAWIKAASNSSKSPEIKRILAAYIEKIIEARKAGKGFDDQKKMRAYQIASDFSTDAAKLERQRMPDLVPGSVNPPSSTAAPATTAAGAPKTLPELQAYAKKLNEQFKGDKAKVKAELIKLGYNVK